MPGTRQVTAGEVTRTSQHGVQLDGHDRWYNYSRDYQGEPLERGTSYELSLDVTDRGSYILASRVQTGNPRPPASAPRQSQPPYARVGGSSDPETVGRITYLSCLHSAAAYLAGSGDSWADVVVVAQHFYKSVPNAPYVNFTLDGVDVDHSATAPVDPSTADLGGPWDNGDLPF